MKIRIKIKLTIDDCNQREHSHESQDFHFDDDVKKMVTVASNPNF